MTERELIELVARAICGTDADNLEPGSCPGDRDDSTAMIVPDGRNRNGEFCHFRWREYEPKARAVLNAIKEHGIKVMEREPEHVSVNYALSRQWIRNPAGTAMGIDEATQIARDLWDAAHNWPGETKP